MSRKSFASLEIDWLVTLSLLETFVFFQLIPCQSTYCHDFTSGTLLHNYSCQAYTIDSAYIRTIISRSTYCFTSRKESWYPPEHSIYNFRELKLFLPNWFESIKISADDLERLWTWTNNCATAVRQRLFHQEIKMTKTGRFFHVIFILTNKQGDRNHTGVNQSKTIIKPTMLIQLKMTQNEKKNTLKMNSLTSFIHPVKKCRRSMS